MNISPFRGRARGLSKMISGAAKKMKNTNNNNNNTGPSSFLGGLFLGSASGGGGGGAGVYTNCKTDDNSFYCRMIRYRSIFSNVLYFVMFFLVFVCIIYFVVIPYLFGGKKGRGRKR